MVRVSRQTCFLVAIIMFGCFNMMLFTFNKSLVYITIDAQDNDIHILPNVAEEGLVQRGELEIVEKHGKNIDIRNDNIDNKNNDNVDIDKESESKIVASDHEVNKISNGNEIGAHDVAEETGKIANAEERVEDSIYLKDGIWPADPLPDFPDFEVVGKLINLTGAGVLGKLFSPHMKKLPKEEQEKARWSRVRHGFVEYTSNLIGVRRTLKDVRKEGCAERFPSTGLPQTTIIICFVNEAWSTLLRTVNSALDYSPAHLVKEIILVDDASTWDFLGKPLDVYMSRHPKVKVLRTGSPVGLMQARMLGYNHSTAPTVTFLDSHCECYPGWLEPLLTPLATDQRVVVTPMIHPIKLSTFNMELMKHLQVGIVDIPSMTFKWRYPPPREIARVNASHDQFEHTRSPAMAGGLFSITKMFFDELGEFDPGLKTWGGENIEMSFKIWMCGGRIETSPCSNVGHIYRRHNSYSGLRSNDVKENIARVATVWMDDYTKYIDGHEELFKRDIGDVSPRRRLREKLQCKNFQWYMDTVVPEMIITGDGIYKGEIRSNLYPDRCIDMYKDGWGVVTGILEQCQSDLDSQQFLLTDIGEIHSRNKCLLEYKNTKKPHQVRCNWGNKERGQYWQYTDKRLVTSSGKCLHANSTEILLIQSCDGSAAQQWSWSFNRAPRVLV